MNDSPSTPTKRAPAREKPRRLARHLPELDAVERLVAHLAWRLRLSAFPPDEAEQLHRMVRDAEEHLRRQQEALAHRTATISFLDAAGVQVDEIAIVGRRGLDPLAVRAALLDGAKITTEEWAECGACEGLLPAEELIEVGDALLCGVCAEGPGE